MYDVQYKRMPIISAASLHSVPASLQLVFNMQERHMPCNNCCTTPSCKMGESLLSPMHILYCTVPTCTVAGIKLCQLRA
jgi:hypothetical protein